MKNKRIWLIAIMLIAWNTQYADDSFFLIKINPKQTGSSAFEVKRNLFEFDRIKSGPIVQSGEIGGTEPPSPQTSPGPAVAGPLPGPVVPRFDVVFLGSIVRKERRCALLAVNGEMTVVESGETLENGWRVEDISLTTLTLKTEKGDMLFAVEGDDHE